MEKVWRSLKNYLHDKHKLFALKKTRASGQNVGKVFNPAVKLVLENQPFLKHKPRNLPELKEGIKKY